MESISKEFVVTIDGKDKKVCFKRPTVEELMQIDLEYRRIYAEAVRAGVMSEAEAKKSFQKSGAWTKNDEDKIDELSLKVALLSKKIEESKEKDLDESLKIIDKISELRTSLMELISERSNLFNNTAEGLANEQRIHKFVELCCYKAESDDKFFDSREAYEQFSKNKRDVLSEIYKQAYFFEYGMPEDMTADWVEVKWLKDHQEEIAAKQKKKKKRNKVKKVG